MARVALRAAQEAAKKNGGRTVQAKSRVARVVTRDGREPMSLGDAIGPLVTERAWEIAAAGVGLCDLLQTKLPSYRLAGFSPS
ncbi:hypothetical protein P9869_43235 [Streptomyces ossamyceticus]|nr:hypothetical protein [Streptomyces ossamyceticus]